MAVREVRATDEDALRDFYADAYQRLTGRLADWHSREWAEDLVQEALLKAWERASCARTLRPCPRG
jgi:DNA-directed RNA polymerase specialized sigma24 family protein